MRPADLAIGQAGRDQLGVVFVFAVLGVGQYGMDPDDGGVLQFGGEEVLLLAVSRGAESLHFNGWQHFAGGQGLIKHR